MTLTGNSHKSMEIRNAMTLLRCYKNGDAMDVVLPKGSPGALPQDSPGASPKDSPRALPTCIEKTPHGLWPSWLANNANRGLSVTCYRKKPDQSDPSQQSIQVDPLHHGPPPVASSPHASPNGVTVPLPQIHSPQHQHLYQVQPDQSHL